MKPPKFNLNIDYFPENDFSTYRKDMLKAINISSITSSFYGLRELSTQLGKLKTEEYSLNDLISILENSKKYKVTTESNEKSEIFEKSFAEKSTEKIKNLQKKPENANLLDSEALEIKKKNYEKDTILLNTLEHYIHDNIKEIKDFKNLVGKGSNSQNQKVDPVNSYNPQENEIVEISLGEKERLLSQKLLRMQQKSKENEINLLIQRITYFQKKEEILAEKLAYENSKINKIINFLTKNMYFNETLIGDISYFDEEKINYNKINFRSKFLLIDFDKFIFFDTDLDSIHLEIPHNQISSISIIVNNNKLSYMTEHDDFNPNKFSGFLINYWEEKELKAIILKNKSYFEQRKLDMILFMVQLMNSFKTKSIIYKTIRSNADLNNSNCNYGFNRINSEVCAKDELLNLTPTSNKMKDSIKKTIQFVLPEHTEIEQSREDTEEKRKRVLAKLEELDYKDQLKKSMKLNNVNYKNQAAKLKLMNGFAFKQKKKIKKSEEIYIVLDTSKPGYFFCLYALHNVAKKQIISLNNAFNIKKWNSNEAGETFFGINIITNNSIIELQASDEKSMESFFECCQNVLIEKREN